MSLVGYTDRTVEIRQIIKTKIKYHWWDLHYTSGTKSKIYIGFNCKHQKMVKKLSGKKCHRGGRLGGRSDHERHQIFSIFFDGFLKALS